MKKFFSILFAALLTLVALTVVSCNKETPEETEPPVETESQDPLMGSRWTSSFASLLGAWNCSICCLSDNRAAWTQITQGLISDVIPGGFTMNGIYELGEPADDGTCIITISLTGAIKDEEKSVTLSGKYNPKKPTTMSLTVTDGEIPARSEDNSKPLLFQLG